MFCKCSILSWSHLWNCKLASFLQSKFHFYVKSGCFDLRILRCSHWMCYNKGILKLFAKFTRKDPCRSLLFNKLAGLGRATFLKKRLQHRSFAVNFAKFLRTPFLRTVLGEYFWIIQHQPEKQRVVWYHKKLFIFWELYRKKKKIW